MAIDDCEYSFKELSDVVLPKLMEKMRMRMASPTPMSLFAKKGVGKRTLLKYFGIKSDFSGCYVLIENETPFYVGISRSVISRLLQHVKGTTHFDASLAYRIANTHLEHDLSRGNAMQTQEMQIQFNKAKEQISKMHVAFIEIKNDLEVYLFEAYCSMELDTKDWNTFATH